MILKSARAYALLAVATFAISLGACEEKKSFKHVEDWNPLADAKPKVIHTDTPEGAADAVETRLADIVLATRNVDSAADAQKAADKMKAAYADLETYYGKLTSQEPKADGPNRQAVARAFFKTQQDLAKSVADLLEKDQKIVEVIGDQLDKMPLVQNPPDPPPPDLQAPDIQLGPDTDPDVPKGTPKPGSKPTSKPKAH